MDKSIIKKEISNLPSSPGVYIFKRGNKILYIGKATSLKDRVRSYFNKDVVNNRSPLIYRMLQSFNKIEHIKTDSVLEALVLEAHLIKKHQPEANIKEKDNKSFNFVVITKEDFPRVLIMRGRDLLNNHFLNKNDYEISYSFGPFPNGSQLKEAMKIVRKMFPFRDKCEPCKVIENKELISFDISKEINKNNSTKYCKPCFNRQIGLCPGVCTGEVSKEDYAKQINNIKLFFEGNKKQLLKNLEKQMQGFAKQKKFEEANITKRTLYTLNHIQDVALIKEESLINYSNNFRIESYDIAHMSGKNVVGVMTVIENGEISKQEYRKFKIKEDPGINDTKALSEVLTRRFAHIEWRFPDLIVVDGGVAQKRVVERVLKENHQKIPVVSVVKDERHKPKEILGDKKWLKFEREILLSNAEAHRYAINFHKQLRRKIF